MSTQTAIEWTELSWNPVTGCTKVSPGCKHCYAETMARRLKAMGMKSYAHGFKLTLQPKRLPELLKRKKPTMVFVNSMSDLFHEDVPESYIDQVMDVIRQTPRHTYQILTKRAEILADYFKQRAVPDNAWLGVTVEDRAYGLPRIDLLRHVNAPIRFLSVEPLLEDLGDIDLTGIHWVIAGGESGPQARAMDPDWVRNVRDACQVQGVKFFFHNWGTFGPDGVRRSKKNNGRILDQRTWDERPQKYGSTPA